MNLTEKSYQLAKEIGGKERLNCIAELSPTALEEAKKQEAVGSEDLPLKGIPVLVKDNIDVKGLHTTAGSLALEDNIALEDAPIIQNLRKNGAIILGKTNMTEFANFVTQGMPGGYSSRGGQVIHPVNPKINPSGSSSGSGVAVAAGIVPMAVGTDTSFSILICAQTNGICGLKPPVGALSPEGIIPLARTMDSAGAMAANFADALKLYSAMREEPFPEVQPAEIKKLRIGVNLANIKMVSASQRRYIKKIIKRLKRAGAVVEELEQGPTPLQKIIMNWEFKPYLEEYLSTSSASLKTLAEIVDYYEAHPDTMTKYGDVYLREALDETPGGLQGEKYLEAMEMREQIKQKTYKEIEGYDAVIIGGPTNIMHFCGMPSVTVAGRAKNIYGVKKGLMLYGVDEYRLYAATLALEALMQK